MTYTFDDRCISDLYKDVHGFRPTQYFMKEWQDMNDDEKQTEWDSLCTSLERTLQEERLRDAKAIVRFEKSVLELMQLVKVNREGAIERIMVIQDATDVEHLEYLLGLPFNYIKGTRK